MRVIITGGAGFLGQQLAAALLQHRSLPFDELLLVDQLIPPHPLPGDGRVRCQQLDLAVPGAARQLVTPATGLLFHLAAVVSSQAEQEFDLGWQVNLDATRQLLDACRQQAPGTRFVFASSLAVYGGNLPALVDDMTVVTPQSSYGIQKAMGEMLVNEYTRKNFVDGRVLRLPTVCVRPGRPNQAASSFVSSLIREPLHGKTAICPVSPEFSLWLSSPDTCVGNMLRAGELDGAALGNWRTVNLPGISVTVAQMLDALTRRAGPAVRERVQFVPDPAIQAIVNSWPSTIDNTRALSLGFAVDGTFDDFVRQYIDRYQPAP